MEPVLDAVLAPPRPGLAGEVPFDLSPPLRRVPASAVCAYVATRLYEGAGLFGVLSEELVVDRRDDHPFLLDELAGSALIREALRVQEASTALPSWAVKDSNLQPWA